VTGAGEEGRPAWAVRSATVHDVEGLVRFNSLIFRPSVGIWAGEMLEGHHPDVGIDDFCVVSDADGAILSSLCIIPQTWRVGGVPMRVGQLELVGTVPGHRGRGFIRAQMEWFEGRLRHHRCLLSSVTGAPTMYQHLGYHFAVPMRGGMRVPAARLPAVAGVGTGEIRPATAADLPALSALFEVSQRELAVCSLRSELLWRYQEGHEAGAEHAYETWVLVRRGAVGGYLRAARKPVDGAWIVRECAVIDEPDLGVLLAWARRRAQEQSLDVVLLQVPSCNPVFSFLADSGGEIVPPWAWQVRVPDWPAFLLALGPVLRDRLIAANSPRFCADVRVVLGERRMAMRLTFRGGRLTEVVSEPESPRWDARLTDATLTVLALGFRSRAAVEDWHLETQFAPEARQLLDTLFPRVAGFVSEPY